MHKGAIFPLLYLPPIEYFHEIFKYSDSLFFEAEEHFPKQTYRSRAVIHSPNGKLNLIVPIEKGVKNHTMIRDIKISYEFNWQRLHWLSLQTSYRNSAYFEFYEDDFAPIFENKTKYLFDLNETILNLLFKLLKHQVTYSFSSTYQKEYADLKDYRRAIHPKVSSLYETKSYFQVFDDRNGFMPNLSIVDLLFNQGPHSRNFI